MARIWLNIDAGEYPEEPEALFEAAHGVSIACGGHAGDEASMDRALARCARFGTQVGAHPSFVDRAEFGRKVVAVDAATLEGQVEEQVARLVARAAKRGQTVTHMKPHGALYHAVSRDGAMAEAVLRASERALGQSFLVVGPGGSVLERVARSRRHAFAREGFADRGTREDGSLIPRGEPGALITDPALARARAEALVREGRVETICVHGDTPAALSIARAVRDALDTRGERP